MEASLNLTVNSTSDNASINKTNQDVYVTPATGGSRGVTVSQDLYEDLINGAACFSIVMGIPGILANVLIIATYTMMGITNSINASYTAMAVSDLGCVVTTIWFEILLMPQFQTWELLPFIPSQILSPTAAYPNMFFAKTTAWITAYISLERCLCVAFPHKVKLMFTKRLTVIILTLIAVFNAIPAALTAFWIKLEWKISTTNPNKTVLGRILYTTQTAREVLNIQGWLYGTVFHWVPIGITVICSIFLAAYLKAGSKWRNTTLQTYATEDKNDPKNLKEERIIQTVLFISVLSILLSTPVSINFIFTLVAPELSPFLFLRGVGTILAAYATAMTMVNSCFNILIYYRLGTKFRTTLRYLLNIHDNNGVKNSNGNDAD